MSQESLWAAEASHCANDQGLFWPFHEKVFAAPMTAGALSRDNLKLMAKAAGLNDATFNSCMDSGKYAGQVSKDNQIAEQSGVNSTPTFFINGRLVMLSGANEAAWLANFKKELDAELAK